ncbi:PqaA protein [Salmonella enterica]|nr:PqaA protein [Salmonella enterica]EGB8191662.1 PqaA protein [Salmonella enterica]
MHHIGEQDELIDTLEAPVKVVRWTANNPNARDFRYACGIRYQPLTIDIPANNKISITLNEPKTGWEATYIEATFNDGYVATSQVYITPDEKYPQTAPPSVNAACQTLPGRGLGENVPLALLVAQLRSCQFHSSCSI